MTPPTITKASRRRSAHAPAARREGDPTLTAPLERKQPRAKIRELRERFGYSESYVARALGIAQPTYHDLEEHSRITLARLWQIARFYGYPFESLAEGYRLTKEEELTGQAYARLGGAGELDVSLPDVSLPASWEAEPA